MRRASAFIEDKRSRGVWLGGALVALVVLTALVGPVVVTADPNRQDLLHVLAAPSREALLGTDHLGRSVLARLVHAARLSLSLGAMAVATAALPGIGLGLATAFAGGWTDRLLTSLADAILAVPGLILVLLIAALSPGAFWPLFLGLSLTQWVEWFRMTRAASRSALASPAVEAARLLGFSPWHILRRHVFPDLLPLFGTLGAFGLGSAVLALGALGFIGFGLRPPTPEWGLMMVEMLPYWNEAPLALLMPPVCLLTLILGLQILARR
ncbi:ABC transporter permease [Rhizobium rhizosphaerae]|uniref:ABC transporter permease n=1 Tax=Xaviernesmea rhizosphaerae TaxID=1672749 RepID=A0A1Q9AHI9_9HYPH|nr:ABC transporter permease [Xaviernesmea rhizosphaerae]OLP54668.1 ABC transporter permease [Xaviernesmea rhizosphaerae]